MPRKSWEPLPVLKACCMEPTGEWAESVLLFVLGSFCTGLIGICVSLQCLLINKKRKSLFEFQMPFPVPEFHEA